MDSVGIKDPIDKLHVEVTHGYASLSKWITALSTGAIAFGVSLIKPDTALMWKQELYFGLGLLVISILAGVRYVRLTIDYSLYNLEVILNTKKLDYFKGLSQEAGYEFEGRTEKVSAITAKIMKGIKEGESNMQKINSHLLPLFNWQQWLFYIGIISIALFGVLSIN